MALSDTYVTLSQAAQITGRSKSVIANWITTKRLTAERLSPHVVLIERVRVLRVDALMRAEATLLKAEASRKASVRQRPVSAPKRLCERCGYVRSAHASGDKGPIDNNVCHHYTTVPDAYAAAGLNKPTSLSVNGKPYAEVVKGVVQVEDTVFGQRFGPGGEDKVIARLNELAAAEMARLKKGEPLPEDHVMQEDAPDLDEQVEARRREVVTAAMERFADAHLKVRHKTENVGELCGRHYEVVGDSTRFLFECDLPRDHWPVAPDGKSAHRWVKGAGE